MSHIFLNSWRSSMPQNGDTVPGPWSSYSSVPNNVVQCLHFFRQLVSPTSSFNHLWFTFRTRSQQTVVNCAYRANPQRSVPGLDVDLLAASSSWNVVLTIVWFFPAVFVYAPFIRHLWFWSRGTLQLLDCVLANFIAVSGCFLVCAFH